MANGIYYLPWLAVSLCWSGDFKELERETHDGFEEQASVGCGTRKIRPVGGDVSSRARGSGDRERFAECGGFGEGDSRIVGSGDYGRVGRAWAADVSAAGSDCGFARCADGYAGGEAGGGVWVDRNWRVGACESLPVGADGGDYRVEWEDHDDDVGGEDLE